MSLGTECTVSEEVIEQYALGMLSEAEVGEFEEHLLVCQSCREKLAETDDFVHVIRSALLRVLSENTGKTSGHSDAQVLRDRRCELRFPCADRVPVRLKGGPPALEAVTARLMNSSESGACIRVDHAVAVGLRLKMIVREADALHGEVRYCSRKHGHHLVGLQFDPGC